MQCPYCNGKRLSKAEMGCRQGQPVQGAARLIPVAMPIMRKWVRAKHFMQG
jgi:hypothetical protein